MSGEEDAYTFYARNSSEREGWSWSRGAKMEAVDGSRGSKRVIEKCCKFIAPVLIIEIEDKTAAGNEDEHLEKISQAGVEPQSWSLIFNASSQRDIIAPFSFIVLCKCETDYWLMSLKRNTN